MSRWSFLAAVVFVGFSMATLACSKPGVEFTLDEVNGSGYSGTVIIAERGGPQDDPLADVSIALTPEHEDVAQLAHIHEGSCDNPGEKAHSLDPVIGGKSRRFLKDVLVADIATGGFYLDVHPPGENIPDMVACGNIPPLE